MSKQTHRTLHILSNLGVYIHYSGTRGRPTQFLLDHLTSYSNHGGGYTHHILLAPQIFGPSDIPDIDNRTTVKWVHHGVL